MNCPIRLFVLFAFGLLCCGGCAAIPLAALGTALGSAGAAASAGSEVYNLGKLDFSVMNTQDECQAAVLATAWVFQLHDRTHYYKNESHDEWIIVLADDRKKTLEVRVERRTSRLCQCRVDVGIFGNEPTAKLVTECMRKHLPEPSENSLTATTPRQ